MSARERECGGSCAGLRLGQEYGLRGLLAGPWAVGELGLRGGPKRERGQAARGARPSGSWANRPKAREGEKKNTTHFLFS